MNHYRYLATVLLTLAAVHAGTTMLASQSGDPFAPYLDGKAPEILREVGSTDAPPENITVKRVVFRSRDNSEIFAVIATPKTSGKHPGILVLHGGGGCAEVEKAMAWAQRGYVAVAPDLPGIADPNKLTETKGKWSTLKYGEGRWAAKPDAGASTLFDAVLAGMKSLYLLRAQPGVDATRVGVVGVSWGGYMTAMVCGLAGDQVRAGMGLYGCGFFERGSGQSVFSKMPEDDREEWLNYLDAGRRVPNMKAAYFLAAASNDFFGYPDAVQLTLNAIPGEKNHVFAPNANHKIPVPGGSLFESKPAAPFTPTAFQPYPTPTGGKANWLAMEVPYFDYYLKGIGQPFPKVNVQKSDDPHLARFGIIAPHPLAKVEVYWAKATPAVLTQDDVKKREWLALPARKTAETSYEAELPAETADWFALVTDDRPVTVSSDMVHVVTNVLSGTGCLPPPAVPAVAVPSQSGTLAVVLPTLDAVHNALDLAQRTLVFVEKSEPRPLFAAELRDLAARVENASKTNASDLTKLLADIRDTRRRLIFSHPLLGFKKLLINKNPPTVYSHNCDQYLGRHSRVGDGPTILEDWKSEHPKETVLLKGKLPKGAFMHPSLSYDATKLVFTYADHTSKDSQLWRYFLYEASLDGSSLRQLTGTPRDPLATWENRETVLIEDGDPCYLPDGGIAFVSSRSQNFGRCHGGRYTPSFLLYRCQGDGSNIRQLSWGEANETTPTVLHDGRILYTRWEYVDRHEMEFHKLWSTRPDGTVPSNFYGNDTIAPFMIAEARTIPNTHKVVATGMGHHNFTYGSIVVIDPDKGENGLDPLTRLTPEVGFLEVPGEINFNTAYASPYPLSEDLFLVAYSPKPISKPISANSFGIYLVDTLGGRELIYRDPNVSCFSPTPVQPVTEPPVMPSSLPPVAANTGTATGTYLIQNVYLTRNDPQGLIKPGQIKSLRFNELINKPARNSAAVSAAVSVEIPKRILGTVPVNPDGSVAVIVPAEVPLQIQALDENGMAIMTERSFHYLQPGETRSCIGCHEPVGIAPPPNRSSKFTSPVALTPHAGPEGEGGVSFAKSVQPVLDRYCIECHGLNGKKAKNISLTGERNTPSKDEKNEWIKHEIYNVSYLSLVPYTKTVGQKRKTEPLAMNISRPSDYYARASKLIPLLLANHAKVQLDKTSLTRVVEWLDMNAQAYGDYSFNRLEERVADPAGEKALRDYLTARFGPELAAEPFAALVNVANPLESRVLKAPLALEAGGWGQIPKGGWTRTSDPDYIHATQLVEAAITPLVYHDKNGTCGRPVDQCKCGDCWVQEFQK